MLKKIVFQFILRRLVILALTPCSSGGDREGTPITLSGWQISPNEQQLLQQVLKKFEAQHPAIAVKYDVITDRYMDVIKTRLMGDAAPNVFYLQRFPQ